MHEIETTAGDGGSEVADTAIALDRDYAAAVIANQAGLAPGEAAIHAAAMPHEQLAALIDAGRDGRVAECRAILGLE